VGGCVAKEGEEQGIRVWTVATNISGNKEALKQRGARIAEVSAQTILGIIEGRQMQALGS